MCLSFSFDIKQLRNIFFLLGVNSENYLLIVKKYDEDVAIRKMWLN